MSAPAKQRSQGGSPTGAARPVVGALLALMSVACGEGAREIGRATAPEDSKAAAEETAWFEEITDASGVHFRHDSGWDGSYYMPEHIGSGGALFDYDFDGDLDLYLVNSGPHGDARGRDPAAANRLYRQEADGSFVDRTVEAGVGDRGYGMGTAVGDVDNDGDLDLYVTNYGPDVLYLNRGDGTFTEATAGSGLADNSWSTSACLFDYDADQDLDLYVVTYVHHDPPKPCTDEAGRPEYCGPLAFRGEADLLYMNNGDGTYIDVSEASGVGLVATRGLGIACLDFDGDGRQDVYVANDGEKNDLWINRGDGTFEDRSLLLGMGLNQQGQAEASMGVAVGDVDGNLAVDLFLSHLDRETNTLYLNLGEAGFLDSTAKWELGPASLPFTGFGTGFFDLELDGDLDLLIANGKVRRGSARPADAAAPERGVREHWEPYAEPNLLFVNEGGGRFVNASERAGPLCRRVEVSRGVMFGDLDDDGDLDVVLTQCDGPTRLYRNEAPPGRWLRIGTAALGGNAGATGSRVVVEAGDRPALGLLMSSFSYLTSTQPLAHFGLAGADRVDRLTVEWSGGGREAWTELPADRQIVLGRKGGGAR